MTTQLIKKWIQENPQSSHSFYVDVLYNLYMNDFQMEQLPIRCLERINTWFYHYNKTVQVFSKKNNQYELKNEIDSCFVYFSKHANERVKERVESFEFQNFLRNNSVKQIIINSLQKNNSISHEKVLLILKLDKKSIGFIIKPAYYDYLLRTIIVVTVLGSQRRYFSKEIKKIEINLTRQKSKQKYEYEKKNYI